MRKDVDKPKLPDPEAVKLRLASLCARSEQCEYDLRQKCVKAGLSPAQTDEIVAFLKEQKFTDDNRFARAYAGDKVRFAGWGVNKIRLSLRQKRIAGDVINEAIASISKKDYIDAMKRVANQKVRSLDMNTQEGRAKFYRYMISRGFESNHVSQMLAYLGK